MYINPFICGVIVTLAIEFVLMVVSTTLHNITKDKDNGEDDKEKN
jgi:hypothetical protein